MEARDGGAGTPLVSQGVMHVVALLAIAGLALALLVAPGLGARAVEHDAFDAAHVITELPFRDDGIRLADATAGPDEPAASCFEPFHTAWYVLQPESDVALTTWVVPDPADDEALDVALSVWRSEGVGPPVELGCID
jgi:hypothetical protein